MNCKCTTYSEENMMRREKACHAMGFVLCTTHSSVTKTCAPQSNHFYQSKYSLSCISPTLSSPPLYPYQVPLYAHHRLGKKEVASIIPGSSVCIVHVLWKPVAAWWEASRSVILLTCGGEFMLHLLPCLRQYLGFPSFACLWVSIAILKG